jgi:peptidoglycan-associated lipoprotein
MRGHTDRVTLTVAGLGLALILLGGCPRRPVVVSESSGVVPAPRPAAPSGAASTPSTPAASKAFVSVPALRDVHFGLDRAEIRPEDEPLLDVTAGWLKAHTEARLLIEGHADERGSSAHNLALAERRARAIRDALVTRGVDVARISLVVHGEQRPLCTERTDSCWARNRRAHFLVSR